MMPFRNLFDDRRPNVLRTEPLDIDDHPRCDLARNRRGWSPAALSANFASCLVTRLCVRFRHILKELVVISDRISLITSPGERPN